MDKAERKQLKREGKSLVEQRSRELVEALARANPLPISDPAWGQNYKEQILREREFRDNPPDYISNSNAVAKWETFTVDDKFRLGHPVAHAQYYECSECRDLVHAFPHNSVQCQCGSLSIDVVTGELSTALDHPIRLVKLLAKVRRKSIISRLFGG